MLLIRKKLDSVNSSLAHTNDKRKKEELNMLLYKYENDMNQFAPHWVERHPSSPYSAAVIRLFIARDLFSGRDTIVEKYFDMLTPAAIRNNQEAYFLARNLSQFNLKYKNFKTQRYEGNETGRLLAPAFTIKDTSGLGISLDDFKGNYLLIDFWASWCGPCRENNPELKRLYHQYKDSGLQVLSISVDTDAEKWKGAIVADGMDWIQGSDLLGIAGGVGKKYLVNGIPNYLLINPDLTVDLAGNTYLEMIENRLRQIFGH